MKNLLNKELRLALHPTAMLFLVLSALLLVPSYPYLVTFFYTGLSVFFTCLSGRENNDVFYTMTLPVAKRDVVRARFLLTILQQLAQVLTAIPFAYLRQKMPIAGNDVGMDANIALFGFAFAMMGLFNLTFFRIYYRKVTRVGPAFAWSSVVMGLFVTIEETCAHIIPFCRDRLDTPDPQFLPEKLAVLAVGVAVYAALTLLACRRAQRDFAQQDL